MNEQKFQELLNKLEILPEEFVEDLLESIKLRKFHEWLDEQEEGEESSQH